MLLWITYIAWCEFHISVWYCNSKNSISLNSLHQNLSRENEKKNFLIAVKMQKSVISPKNIFKWLTADTKSQVRNVRIFSYISREILDVFYKYFFNSTYTRGSTMMNLFLWFCYFSSTDMSYCIVFFKLNFLTLMGIIFLNSTYTRVDLYASVYGT